jgi:hypothetical protein
MKSKIVAYLLWLIGICGCLGFHRFYLGKTKSGLLWLFSGGLVGIGSLVDLVSLNEQVRQVNRVKILEKLASGEEVEFKQQAEVVKNKQIAIGGYCPYCMGILGHKPKRDIKCPSCQKEIYYRPDQTIFENDLLSLDEALVVDYLVKFERFGISAAEFKQKRAELQEKFGPEITTVDVFWNLLRNAMINTKETAKLKKIHRHLAFFLRDLHQDFYYILQRAIKMQLLELRNDGSTKRICITTGPEPCSACRELNGKIYTVEEALTLMPLPCKDCSGMLAKKIRGFCRCSFIAVDN